MFKIFTSNAKQFYLISTQMNKHQKKPKNQQLDFCQKNSLTTSSYQKIFNCFQTKTLLDKQKISS